MFFIGVANISSTPTGWEECRRLYECADDLDSHVHVIIYSFYGVAIDTDQSVAIH